MPTSIVKFMGQASANGQPLHWGRVDRDGYPYIGGVPPMLPDAELEQRATQVAYPHNRVFDLSDPGDNRQYLEALDHICNGWAKLIYRKIVPVKVSRRNRATKETIIDVKFKVYLEWADVFMKDGQPSLAQQPYLGGPNEG